MSLLPPGLCLLERGWLSSNNLLLHEGEGATLVDSGYASHAAQTVALVRHALAGRRLTRLVNTHSHSDHIGGNAALKRAFGCAITIPAGMAGLIGRWDEKELLFTDTRQWSERFAFDATVAAGDELEMGGLVWRAIAGPGHDPHHLIYYNESRRLLISGDVLWRNGFGVVFGALYGDPQALAATRATLESVGRLAVDVVIPGHGPAFAEFDDAMANAWRRLASFEQNPERLARHAARVIFTFALLEAGSMALADLPAYLADVPLYRSLNERFLHQDYGALADGLLADLQRAGAVRLEGAHVVAAGRA